MVQECCIVCLIYQKNKYEECYDIIMEWHKLSRLRPDKIRRFQDKKLRYFMQHEAVFSPYYRDLFKKHDLQFSDIRTTADLKKIPFTSKKDIAPTKKDPTRPKNIILQPDEALIKKHSSKMLLASLAFQRLFGQKAEDVFEYAYKPIHIHFTTGRTSNPTPFLYSKSDIGKMRECGKRLYDVFGISADDVLVNAFPYAPHLAFWLTYNAAEAGSIRCLHTGGGKIMGTNKILTAMQNMQASTLAVMPGYCYHLLQTAAEKKTDLRHVKTLVFGGERVPDGLKDKLKVILKKLGAKKPRILSTYAFTEGKIAWGQCAEGSGYHLYPDFEFVELVDKHGERVEEDGEIVYTALDWHGSVVLRYKTGDITKGLYTNTCPLCKRTVPRLDPDIQRSSEFTTFTLTKVKGVLVNLNEFFPLMMGHKDVDEWQVEIKKRRNDPFEVDELVLYVAPRKNANIYNLKKDLKEKVREIFEITPDILEVNKQVLLDQLGMETELKEKRIIDRRPKR